MFVLLRQTNPQRKTATSHCLGIGLQTQRVLVQTLIKPTVWKKGTTSNEDDLKRKLFLEFENFVLLDALGSAWLQKSIFEKDHFWLERQFDPASDERNDSRISCYVKESVGDNPADGRNIKTSTESNIQVSLKRKSHGLLLT